MDGEGRGALLLILAFAIGATLYVLPTLIARQRRHQSLPAIVVVNLLAGWTFLGWIAALAWSLSATAPQGAAAQSPLATSDGWTYRNVPFTLLDDGRVTSSVGGAAREWPDIHHFRADIDRIFGQ